MLIGFDCRIIRDKNPAGISWVVLESLRKILSLDRKNEYLLIFDSIEIKDYVLHYLRHIKKQYRVMIVPFSLLGVKNLIHLPAVLESKNIDVYYLPYYFTTPFHKKSYKVVLTVFDLIHFFYPKLKMGLGRKLFHLFKLAPYLVLRRADKIITISINTSRDLIHMFRVPSRKIKMIYVGVSERFRKVDMVLAKKLMREKYSIQKNYILYVGRNEPHKNIKALIGAYALLPQAVRDSHTLVLAGKEEERYAQSIHDFVNKLHITENVVFTGYVDESDLPYVYSGASVFVFPSFYEGFGMPVLEAMACEVPVICSDSSCLPEAGGNAALYFHPEDVRDLTSKLYEVLSNSMKREDMIKKGKVQVRKFTWFNSISQLIECLEQVVHGDMK
ncbi:MAG: glycosyltransferase family 1 protein [Patescibacteria group bacterium]